MRLAGRAARPRNLHTRNLNRSPGGTLRPYDTGRACGGGGVPRPKQRPGPPPPTGEAPAVARHGPRGGPYFLQRRGCVFCHTPLCHGLVASWTDMDGEWFQVVTCLSRHRGGCRITATTCGF
ncbi:hypothetical protein GCM10009601_14700 [Streptomyces thermospinosisporus]|uniref:Uncharacterized protein n=1 Tax=Streptomyces thermospinosisporus TaxID=161482 RepID=A0ABN1YNI9_9ACTN